MRPRFHHRGIGLFAISLVLFAMLGALLAIELAASGSAERERITERALAQAREALVAYAADRPITPAVGPGYLPCPDLDDDGWAESTCGSLAGDVGQDQRLGRLPWKTLGLPDLRDGHGERLWYAVSTKYKGLLNCAASSGCVDMSPAAALGTITVRERDGSVLHDGRIADPARAQEGGAAAVVIAPGPPITRLEGEAGYAQQRECAPGDCDANGRCLTDPPRRAARCDPRNYLDLAPGARYANEDNAAFVDRSDAGGRARNIDGFIRGPVVLDDGRLAVNDRVAVVSHGDVMARSMGRVALEVAHCLGYYASRPENASRLPWPEPACGRGPFFGSVPDTPFDSSVRASSGGMLPRWWRSAARSPEALAELPTQPDACRIAVAPLDDGPQRRLAPGTPAEEGATATANSWWRAWKPYVFYALAPGRSPARAEGACGSPSDCIDLVDADGRVLSAARPFALDVRHAASRCDASPIDCDELGCRKAIALPPGLDDVVLAVR